MQNASRDWVLAAKSNVSVLQGLWVQYSLHGDSERKVAEITKATASALSVEAMVMFTREPPRLERFEVSDLLSPMSVFIRLGSRRDFEWIQIGAYVQTRSDSPRAYDRVRDIFDGHVFFMVHAPVSLLDINSRWTPLGPSMTSQAESYIREHLPKCAVCNQVRLTTEAQSKPQVPVPVSTRVPVESNVWTKLLEDK